MTEFASPQPMRDGEGLGKPLRVRVDDETLSELDALQSFLVGSGLREVTRSTLVRRALTAYLAGVRDEMPEAFNAPTRNLSVP